MTKNEALNQLIDWVQWQRETEEREHAQSVEDWFKSLDTQEQLNIGRCIEEQKQHERIMDMLDTIETLAWNVRCSQIEEQIDKKQYDNLNDLFRLLGQKMCIQKLLRERKEKERIDG